MFIFIYLGFVAPLKSLRLVSVLLLWKQRPLVVESVIHIFSLSSTCVYNLSDHLLFIQWAVVLFTVHAVIMNDTVALHCSNI